MGRCCVAKFRKQAINIYISTFLIKMDIKKKLINIYINTSNQNGCQKAINQSIARSVQFSPISYIHFPLPPPYQHLS